ncbi:MAG: poly(hydroxyalcanoate) granule associated protein, partial [Acinetobacter sp.]|nr:poly(hydroxyalcanoate) granule associated protein [Acinetobacter sp.]
MRRKQTGAVHMDKSKTAQDSA